MNWGGRQDGGSIDDPLALCDFGAHLVLLRERAGICEC